MTTTKKQRKKTKLQVSAVWSTPPTDAQKTVQPGNFVTINNGTFKGTSGKVITNPDRRGYIVEVTNDKQYNFSSRRNTSSFMKALLLLLTMLTACVTVIQHPIGQWAPIGSRVTAWVINETHDSISIHVEAPELSMTRTLGTVPACDSVVFVIPFGDTKVVMYANNRIMASFTPNAPKTWRFIFRSNG